MDGRLTETGPVSMDGGIDGGQIPPGVDTWHGNDGEVADTEDAGDAEYPQDAPAPKVHRRRPEEQQGRGASSPVREFTAATGLEPEEGIVDHPVASYHQQQLVHHQQRAEHFLRRAQVHDQIARDHAAMADVYRNRASGGATS